MDDENEVPIIVDQDVFNSIDGKKCIIQFEGYLFAAINVLDSLYVLGWLVEDKLIPRKFTDRKQIRNEFGFYWGFEYCEITSCKLIDFECVESMELNQRLH